MYGVAGQWFKPFALTIASSVAVSLFVSFSLDPMLSAYWADPHREEHEKWWITKKLDVFNHWFNRQAQNYKKVIGWALDHRMAMVLMAVLSFFAAFLLPASGFTRPPVALAGIAIIVFGPTPRGFSEPVPAGLLPAGLIRVFLPFTPG